MSTLQIFEAIMFQLRLTESLPTMSPRRHVIASTMANDIKVFMEAQPTLFNALLGEDEETRFILYQLTEERVTWYIILNVLSVSINALKKTYFNRIEFQRRLHMIQQFLMDKIDPWVNENGSWVINKC